MRDALLSMSFLGLLASSAFASGYGIDVGPLATLDEVALEVSVGETLANPSRSSLPRALFEGEPEEAKAFEVSVLKRVAKVLRKGGLTVTERASPHWLHLTFLSGGSLQGSRFLPRGFTPSKK